QPPLATDLARHASHFRSERTKLFDHGVQGFFELQDFAADVHRDLLGKVAVRDCGSNFRDVANLTSQVRSHEVDVVGEIFPRAGNTRHLGLAAQLAFGTDFTGHTRYFAGERVQLVHHRVDGVLELQNFAFDIDGDFAGQIAAGNSGGDFGDI